MWYYYLINLSKDSNTTTDRFKNFLLEYKDKVVVNKYVNLVARQHVNITAPSKRLAPHPMRGSFIDQAQIDRESFVATELTKIDQAQQPEEFKQLVE